MIKVNLLPVKRRKKPKPVPTFMIWGVLLLIVSAIVLFYVNYYMGNQIAQLEEQKVANEQKIKQLQDTITEVEKFKKLNDEVAKNKEVIEKLWANQSIPARILDEMSKRLSDGVWLTDVAIKEDLKMEMTGVGFKASDIVGYVQSLKDSKMFTDVVLIETTAEKADTIETFRFRITLAVKL